MKKICFIGGNGFLASSFGIFFNNIDVFGLNAPQNYSFDKFTKMDIVNNQYTLDWFINYDYIFYFSALGVQSKNNCEIKDVYKVNTLFPIEIISFLNSKNYSGIFITFGSYFEIGMNNKPKKFSEIDILSSINELPNDYCISKKLLSNYLNSSELKIKFWHLILPTIYGPNENHNRLIPYIINSIMGHKEILLTEGSQLREYILVDEIPKIVNNMISNNIESGIFNVSGTENLTIKELALLIVLHFNYPIEKIKFGETKRQDSNMAFLSLNGEKLLKKLNYSPKGTINQNINLYLK